MWNLIFSIIISFETEDKSQDHAETWEPRCRLIQDENRIGEEGKEGLLLLSSQQTYNLLEISVYRGKHVHKSS